MQRWKTLQGKRSDEDEQYTFPRRGSSNSIDVLGMSTSSGLSTKDKIKTRWRKDSSDSLLPSSPLQNAKLPRPRSWVNNLLKTGSNSSLSRFAVSSSSSPRGRYHSFDAPPSSSSFDGGSDVQPVSSLVLQNEFTDISARPNPWDNAPISYSSPEADDAGENEEDEEAIKRPPRFSTRKPAGASRSVPSLPLGSSSATVARKPVPLLVRNLDDAPRGTVTPLIPPAAPSSPIKKKMTNPWGRLDKGSLAARLDNRKELIDAEEEEAMMDEAVLQGRRDGTMAEEEMAVLDMLDQMNQTVDTFEKPTVSRAQSRATNLSHSRPKTPPIDDSNSTGKQPTLLPPTLSPTRLSVKAFANSLDQKDAQSRSSSPVRGSSQRGSSVLGGDRNGVKQVIEQREKLDLQVKLNSGSLSSAISSVLRKKSSFGSYLSGGFLSSATATEQANKTEEENNEAFSLEPSSPQRRGFVRQDSTATSSSYASQTNAFLERRPTHAAEKHLTRSPGQESYISSSGHGSSSSVWDRPLGMPDTPSTNLTSPGLPSGSEDGLPFKFGHGKAITGTAHPPLLRRLLTDATGVTSLHSSDETSTSPTKQISTAATLFQRSATPVSESPTRTQFKMQDSNTSTLTRTPTKAALQRVSTRPPPTPPQKDVLALPAESPRRPMISPYSNSMEGGVSPGQLGTPKRAKDLIAFFEQSSAPNSPQLASRTNTPTPAIVDRYKKAFASSSWNDQDRDTTSITAMPSLLQPSAISQRGALRESVDVFGGRPQQTADRTVSGMAVVNCKAGVTDFQSTVKGPSVSYQGEENVATVQGNTGNNSRPKGSRQASASFFTRMMKQSPDRKAGDEIDEAVRSTWSKEDKLGTSPSRKSAASSFKGGMNRLVSAMTPRGSKAESMAAAETSSLVSADSDKVSVVSRCTIGTSRSFRQKSENDRHLQLDSAASVDLIGQPGASPLRTGFVYYFNVHDTTAHWQRVQAVLLSSAIALSWIPSDGGRKSIVFDLEACQEVHSAPGPEHPSSAEDPGAQKARECGLGRLSPWQLVFEDGIERLAGESAIDRVQWVNAIWEVIGSSAAAARQMAQIPSASSQDTANSAPSEEHATMIAAPSSDAPLNFNVQLSDSPVQGIAAKVGPPVPAKDSPRRKRFIDEDTSVTPAALPLPSESAKSQSDFSEHTGTVSTSVVNTSPERSLTRENTASFTKKESHLSGDFPSPSPPRSDAVFDWKTKGSDREIQPGDSASQRPARSQTASSRFTAIVRSKLGLATNERAAAESASKTAAQILRDNYTNPSSSEESKAMQNLEAVAEEVTAPRAELGVVAQASTNEANLCAAGGHPGLRSTSKADIISNNDIQQLLQYFKMQQQEREQRDVHLETQIKTFQEALSNMQQSASATSTSKILRQDSPIFGAALNTAEHKNASNSLPSAVREAAAMKSMQDKLDRVLALVGPDTPRPTDEVPSTPSELGQIEQTLHSLLRRLQPNSSAGSLPTALTAKYRQIDLLDGRALDGRDCAILTDRLVRGTVPSTRRMSAPPDIEDELEQNAEGSSSRQMTPSLSATLLTTATLGDSHHARSWLSDQRLPGPSSKSKGPEASRATVSDPFSVPQRSSDDQLHRIVYQPAVADMDAEVRRRRVQQTGGARAELSARIPGEWYSPNMRSPVMVSEASSSQNFPGKGLGLSVDGQPLAPPAHISQAIQTPAIEDRKIVNSDLATILAAIKANNDARQAQEKQQAEIAKYLNDLNSWLEKDVVSRSQEWRTLAMGVTQLHEELNAIKTGKAIDAVRNGPRRESARGIAAPIPVPISAASAIGPANGGTQMSIKLGPAEMAASGPSGPRAMPGLAEAAQAVHPVALRAAAPTAANVGNAAMNVKALPTDLPSPGWQAPAPVILPGPAPTVKRSSTRTWRAEAAAGAQRNEDAWSRLATIKDKKQLKEEKKAEGRARRRSGLADSTLGRIATAAGTAALLAAAKNEFDRHREHQRQDGKPEEASKHIDEKSGSFVRHDELPQIQSDKIEEAVRNGDEAKVREAIKDAAEVGAGTAAMRKLIEWIRGSDKKAEDEEKDALSNGRPSEGSMKEMHTAASTGSRTAKSSASASTSEASDTHKTLRDAVAGMSAGGAGGGALALAVEEILKHLLDKKEEEKQKARAEAEAAAKRKADEEEREIRMLAQREKEKNELVETILTKLQQEKAMQEADMAAKRQEMDPKTAIESLVSAINQQRATDAAHHASTDAAMKKMAADLVSSTSEQNGKLVEAVHGAAREMLRHNIETHADELKRLLTKEVSSMFEDVGKIREAKRSLEQEIADLFHIKSRHLADVRRDAGKSSSSISLGGSAPAPKSLPTPQPSPDRVYASAASHNLPPIPVPAAMPLPMMDRGMTGPSRKRTGDLIGPFSVNFGPRR